MNYEPPVFHISIGNIEKSRFENIEDTLKTKLKS